jgi:hypothetical protein
MASRFGSEGEESFLREAIAWQAASGLSVRAFCRRESLKEPSFYSWRRTLAARDGKRPAPAARTRRRGRGEGAPDFVPAVVRPVIAEAPIVLELPGGGVLKLPSPTPVAHLVELVLALESRRGR